MIKNIFVGAFLIILIIFSIIALVRNHSNKEISKKQVYLDNCILNLQSLNLTDKQEINVCVCSHDYLFEKYGKEIYKENFVVLKREDSLAMIECMLKTLDADSISSRAVLEKFHSKARKR